MAVYAVRQTVFLASGLRRPPECSRQGPDGELGRGLTVPEMSNRVPLTSGCGDICDGERAAAYKQPATESCQCSPQKKLRALTQQTLPREDGACGKESANLLLFCLCMRDDVKQTVDVQSESPLLSPVTFEPLSAQLTNSTLIVLRNLSHVLQTIPRTQPGHPSVGRNLFTSALGSYARVFLATVVQI